MSSPQFGDEEPVRRHLRARLQWSSEQTIGPLPAEKPELAANPEQPSQASYFGDRDRSGRHLPAAIGAESLLQFVGGDGLVRSGDPVENDLGMHAGQKV